jgi:zinc transport system substrate-binding protein
MIVMPIKPATLIALLLAASVTGCSSGSGGESGSTDSGEGSLEIVTSFYPLQYVTQRIAGDRATVSNLTPSGAEPHDIELTPKDVAAISSADLLVYLGGFQAQVDDAVRTEGGDAALDVAPAADLTRTLASSESESADQESADSAPQTDPHFWLDPIRLRAVSAQIATRLAAVDPDGAATYQANEKALATDLTALDGELRAGLSGCQNRDIVTSHTAFGYLAQRYDMTQVGILGLSPDAEPDPADLAKVTDFVRANSVRTIYYETLVSPAIARTVASETGAATAVLDPLEGLSSASAGTDYLTVMRANLASLQKGQPCP